MIRPRLPNGNSPAPSASRSRARTFSRRMWRAIFMLRWISSPRKSSSKSESVTTNILPANTNKPPAQKEPGRKRDSRRVECFPLELPEQQIKQEIAEEAEKKRQFRRKG